jgi:hypothetical protein
MRLACLVALITVAACGGPGGPSSIDAQTSAPDADVNAPDAMGQGAICGGKIAATCAEGLYCEFQNNGCGFEDGTGTCEPRPTACPESPIAQPVCGCDGQVYDSECAAEVAGTDVDDYAGNCTPPPQTFRCGHLFCSSMSEYCQIDLSDVVGWPNGYACLPTPGACPDSGATCECVADQPCGTQCDTSSGGVTVSCPGG